MSEILYKFLPAESALSVLEEKRLKVSVIHELNDVYDCAPIPVPIARKKGGPLKSEWGKNLVDLSRDTCGLVSFSKDVRSPLLWGHYAASGTGLALGFDSDFFDWKGAIPLTVDYDRARPSVPWPKNNNFSDENVNQVFRALYGVKAREWKYEREVRYILRLSTCDPQAGMYFAPFTLRALNRVIIGYRSSVKANYLGNFLEKQYKGIEVSLRIAEMHPTKYEIQTKKVATKNL